MAPRLHPGIALALAALASGAALAGSGCGTVPATQVMVELSADDASLEKAAKLLVEVLDHEGQPALRREIPVDRDSDPMARVPLVPRDGDPSRRFVLRAKLLDASGATVSALEAHAGYVDQELRVLRLSFDATCKLKCAEGTTCFDGRCVGACFTPQPAEEASTSQPTCGECEICGDDCQAAGPIDCGCPGDKCDLNGDCVPAVGVRHVAAAKRHTCAVVDPEDVYCWGSTTFDGNLAGKMGRLGTGAEGTDSPTPVLVVGAHGRDGIVAGPDFTCSFSGDERSCWGSNYGDQLGGSVPSLVPEPHTFTQGFELLSAASGFGHVCGLAIDHELWCWGSNGYHQIASDGEPVPVPTSLGKEQGYQQVAAGGDRTCAIDAEGQLLCWGRNDTGQCGVTMGEDTDVVTPTRAGCDPDASQDGCFEDWKAVGAGLFHTCGILESGKLYCWGGNRNGQVGIGLFGQNVYEPTAVESSVAFRAVAGGQNFTCALEHEDGALYCWGNNEVGQLGIADAGNLGSPTQVDPDAVGWTSLGLGQQHACAIRADQTLWCWGLNTDGQVGIGERTQAAVRRPRRVCLGPTPP